MNKNNVFAETLWSNGHLKQVRCLLFMTFTLNPTLRSVNYPFKVQSGWSHCAMFVWVYSTGWPPGIHRVGAHWAPTWGGGHRSHGWRTYLALNLSGESEGWSAPEVCRHPAASFLCLLTEGGALKMEETGMSSLSEAGSPHKVREFIRFYSNTTSWIKSSFLRAEDPLLKLSDDSGRFWIFLNSSHVCARWLVRSPSNQRAASRQEEWCHGSGITSTHCHFFHLQAFGDDAQCVRDGFSWSYSAGDI